MSGQARTRRGWTQNPEAVREDILSAAISEFAAHGLSGARVDRIAARTETSKRMIYYYFGDKLGLYSAALETAYAEVRHGEETLDLDRLSPMAALERLVAFTFDHHRSNPDFIRMVMIENIHNAAHLSNSEVIRDLNTTAIDRIAELCRRGAEDGTMRPDVDPVALHWQISALSFFNVSNEPTFSALFGEAFFSDDMQIARRRMVVEAVMLSVGALRPAAPGPS
ncbi:TetR/AcrR family transcriptional regulator [Roseobacter sp. HKCCA0434]|uniref:TetR/AcrR family transcriptional regulator n=1 Tax=Roseobacter sp. HKCCA0434 TaxID=3079297 RepID=UPI002905F2E5|nr:TetR/AcrR family transcriptional regulator [Roseobacter sp. HKCCA0434]